MSTVALEALAGTQVFLRKFLGLRWLRCPPPVHQSTLLDLFKTYLDELQVCASIERVIHCRPTLIPSPLKRKYTFCVVAVLMYHTHGLASQWANIGSKKGITGVLVDNFRSIGESQKV